MIALLAAIPAGAATAQPQPEYATGGHRVNVARNAPVGSRLVAAGVPAPVSFALVAGALPPGIELDATGAFHGASAASGDHGFRIRATAMGGATGEADFVITVNPAALLGTVQSREFVSPSTGLVVPFTIYLPPGYVAGNARYPVVYHLHGIGGGHQGGHVNTLPRSLEAARLSGLIRPMILVFPDGFGDTFWADSTTSAKPAETHLVTDLVPHIDSQYRTIADARFRIASGYSMGGFGAAKLATKFPDRFATGVIYDGALLTWTQIQLRHPQQAAEIFAGSAAIFDAYSPWRWLADNAAALAGPVRLRDAVGALVNENRAWRTAVLEAGVAVDVVETGLSHQLGPILDAQGANTWMFIETRLAAADRIFANGWDTVAPWRW